MSDVVSLARRVGHVETSPQFTDYSKVLIHVDEETVIEVGNDTGRTLEFTNPFATQQMANDILAKLQGFQYQPYTASDALLDPAAEIGDAANMRGAYGGIYKRERKYNELMPADIAAPHDEEINHEYAFESPETRQFTRQIGEVKASLIVASNNILAQVVKQEDGNTSSFGWQLLHDSWKVYSNGTPVLSVDQNGLEVAGTIKAGTKIGSGSGFVISASAIYNNISSFGGSQSTGVYIGTNGIQLGQAFKVTSSGAVTATNISANNMTLTGTLNIGGTNITAAALRGGAQSAYSNGSYWSSGSGYGYNYHNATQSGTGSYPSYFTVGYLRVTSGISMSGKVFTPKTKTIAGTTITYLGA